jgi:SulP family sulfate permease
MSKIFQPKFFSLLKQGFNKKQLTADALSGIVVGIVALPLAIAFAAASGVTPDKGLITAVIAGFIISFLGGSRVQIGGPTGAFIIIVYSIVEQHGVQGLMISTVLAGILLVVMGFLRLGNLLKYIPHPLIVGFTSGIALVIFSTQIRDALGMDIDKVPSPFVDKWISYFQHLHTINPYAVGITLITMLIIIYSRIIIAKIPGSFLAIVFMTLATHFLNLPVTTIETFFGEIPSTIQFSMPTIVWSSLPDYLEPALTIALLGAIESLLSAVVADGMISGNHRSNTELIAQGAANIIAPFFGGIPATGAIARTATNVKNGGRTPVAGIVHALVLLIIMLFVGRWAKLIPMSCLAGVLIVVAYNMSEWRSFRSILKASFFDKLVLLVTFFLTVIVDLVVAIEVGIVLSALLFMKRMADIGVKLPNDIDNDVIDDYSQLPAGVNVYEISGPLFFASAKEYAEVIKSTGIKSSTLIIRMRHVPFIDSTGLNNFKDALKIVTQQKTRVILSGVNKEVLEQLETNGVLQLLEANSVFDSFDKALKNAE